MPSSTIAVASQPENHKVMLEEIECQITSTESQVTPESDSSQGPPSSPTQQHTDTPIFDPEGTLRGWLVVLGSLCINFSTWGFVMCIGVLQSYWLSHQLSSYSSSAIGWIASVNTFLGLTLGAQVGPLFDLYGPRWILLAGSVGYVLSLVLLAECTKYWHFMLVYGILSGISIAFCATVAVSVIAQWFKKKRGQASGIVFVGTALGGVLYPLILQPMLAGLGWTWSLRIIALLNFILIVVGNVCIKERLVHTKKPAILFDLKLFGNPRFAWTSVGIATFELVYVCVVGILPTYTVTIGLSTSTSFLVVIVMNIGSTFGRLVAGIAADHFGQFNIMLCTLLAALLSTTCFWIPLSSIASTITTTSLALIYTFAFTFGFSAGSIISLAPVCFGELCHVSDYGKYYGTGYGLVGIFVLVSIPIGGALLTSVGERGLVGFLTGLLGVSLICFAIARWTILRRQWVWKVKI